MRPNARPLAHALPRLAWLVPALLAACTSVPRPAASASRPALPHYNLSAGGVALGGYDPVSYRTPAGDPGTPQKGDPALSLDFRGVTYRFASPADREAFARDPERFEPAYGGWCAWAMVNGEKVDVDPEAFVLQDGALLLFYRGIWGDTRASWQAGDRAAEKGSADQAWTKLSGEHAGAAPDRGLGLGGKDPLAPDQAGDPAITTRVGGTTYRFASDAHRTAFLADPATVLARAGAPQG